MNAVISAAVAKKMGGDFTPAAGILAPEKKLVAMPARNDKTPQGRLEFIVAQSLFRIDAELEARKNPPHEDFKASVVLEGLRDQLSDYQAGQMNREGYTVFTQLIANEIAAINDCVNGSCKVRAQGMLEAYQENNSVAKPGVEIKYSQPAVTI